MHIDSSTKEIWYNNNEASEVWFNGAKLWAKSTRSPYAVPYLYDDIDPWYVVTGTVIIRNDGTEWIRSGEGTSPVYYDNDVTLDIVGMTHGQRYKVRFYLEMTSSNDLVFWLNDERLLEINRAHNGFIEAEVTMYDDPDYDWQSISIYDYGRRPTFYYLRLLEFIPI